MKNPCLFSAAFRGKSWIDKKNQLAQILEFSVQTYQQLSAILNSVHPPVMASSNGNIFRVTGPLWRESMHRSPVDSPHKGQWRGALMSLIFAWKRLSKQSRSRWFETPSLSIWCHCNAQVWFNSSADPNLEKLRTGDAYMRQEFGSSFL